MRSLSPSFQHFLNFNFYTFLSLFVEEVGRILPVRFLVAWQEFKKAVVFLMTLVERIVHQLFPFERIALIRLQGLRRSVVDSRKFCLDKLWVSVVCELSLEKLHLKSNCLLLFPKKSFGHHLDLCGN
jgi:hypothetical protein